MIVDSICFLFDSMQKFFLFPSNVQVIDYVYTFIRFKKFLHRDQTVGPIKFLEIYWRSLCMQEWD